MYFAKDEAFNILIQAKGLISWTDGKIVVICTDKVRGNYSIVASGMYMGLIEP